MKNVMTWEERAVAAERTVEVLKARVHALYNGESSSTIEKQLERAQRRQEDARRRRAVIEARNAELAKHSAMLEEQVKDRTRDIRTILDNVTSGFLVIGPDLLVRPGYSRSCHELFAVDAVAGVPLHTLLRLDGDRQLDLEMAVQQVFDDILPDAVSVDLIPRRFPIDERALRVDARVVREDGVITSMLLTITDITSLERAQRQAEVDRMLIGILRQRSAFYQFALDVRECICAARDAVRAKNHVYVRRAVHTIKGNAASFGMNAVVDMCHQIEGEEVIGLSELGALEDAFSGFLDTHRSVLEVSYQDLGRESYEVSETAVDALRMAAQRDDRTEVERLTGEIVLKRADVVAGPLGVYVEKLAERLEKRIDFVFQGESTLVDGRLLRPIFRNLSHLLRNSVDHGIEVDREDKPARGVVELTVDASGSDWVISVRDDGRGIAPDHVAATAVRKGFAKAEEVARMSEQEKLGLIFMDGFSTTDQATDISGRGVGMSAISSAVKDLGGTLLVDSLPGMGTRIEIRVPKRSPSVRPQRQPSRSMSPAMA